MPQSRRIWRFAPLIPVVLVALIVGTVLATPGDLDTSFDGDGIVTTNFGALAEIAAVAVQSDGKIVAAGGIDGVAASFVVARYNGGGSLDNTFDGDGIVAIDLAGAFAHDVAIQADGKIVAVGGGFALARFNGDGSLDTSFDGDGKLTTAIGSVFEANAIAVQSDGKIVAAGVSDGAFALARYNSNGSLDTTFDGDGIVTTNFGSSATSSDVAIQTDGKIVVAGGD